APRSVKVRAYLLVCSADSRIDGDGWGEVFGPHREALTALFIQMFLINELKTEIEDFLTEQKLKLNNAKLVLLFPNRCWQSWLLGNRKIYFLNPQEKPLLDYTRYYDVSVNCPENMGRYQDFNTHAQFHGAYLRALFEAKNITYSKKRPGDVLKPFYLEQLLARIQVQPEHLTTFRHFIDFCNIVKSKLPN
ncbi:MAG: hypothetical protein M3N42_04435, partial [Cyanobacteriota bacterium]|nr:hypothetical protein [Cyanobacteriota bacterium]